MTDWGPPSTAALARASDPRVAQFWDKNRLVSKSMGEHDKGSVMWDYVAVYPRGAVWHQRPPEALYTGRPVARVVEPARNAIARALTAP